jgi:P-type Mg2+ transporter
VKIEQDPIGALYAKFNTSEAGLSIEEAKRRLAEVGPNEPAHEERASGLFQFVRFFANPLVIILLIASAVSAAVGELINASIIAGMVLLSVALNFLQTYRSHRAVERLRAGIVLTATSRRNRSFLLALFFRSLPPPWCLALHHCLAAFSSFLSAQPAPT